MVLSRASQQFQASDPLLGGSSPHALATTIDSQMQAAGARQLKFRIAIAATITRPKTPKMKTRNRLG